MYIVIRSAKKIDPKENKGKNELLDEGLNVPTSPMMHFSFEKAEREARRLAANNPGFGFYVFRAVKCEFGVVSVLSLSV